MISIVIQTHKESVAPVLKQCKDEWQRIVVTSPQTDLEREEEEGIDVLIENIDSCGGARNAGGGRASRPVIFFADAHICFKADEIERVAEFSLRKNAVVAPVIRPADPRTCKLEGGRGGGVRFSFKRFPFEWVWLPVQEVIHKVPFVCGCAFLMPKRVFNLLMRYGGFLQYHQGLGWEEEATMRLWRLGIESYVYPYVSVGHYFKRSWPSESHKGFYTSRVQGLYINVFDLCEPIMKVLDEHWHNWRQYLREARLHYKWLRETLRRYPLNESWFLEV